MTPRPVDVTIKGKDETKGAFSSATSNAKASVDEIKGQFGVLGHAMEQIHARWQMFLGILAGGALFKKVIEGTLEWTASVVQLSKRLGITTEEASGLNVALHHIGMTVDDYAAVAQKMTKQLRTNEEAFHHLGISTRTTNGEWRNSQDVMADAITRLNGLKEGTDRNIAAQTIFGARVGNLTGLMRLNKDMLEESRKKAEEYHLIIGPEGAAQALKYKDALADVKLIGESLEVQLGSRLLPVLTEIGMELGKHGPEFAAGFGKSLKFVATAGLEGYAAINALGQSVKFLNTVLSTKLDGNYVSTVKAAFYAMGEQVTRVNESVQSSILKIRGFGGRTAAESERKDGGGFEDDPAKTHAKYLEQLHKEVEELAKGAELGTLRNNNLRRAIELQEKLLSLASDPRASLADRNSAASGANRLEPLISGRLGTPALVASAPLGAKKGPMANIGGIPGLVEPEKVQPGLDALGEIRNHFDLAAESASMFGDAAQEAMLALVTHSGKAGEAFKGAILRAITTSSFKEGTYWAAKSLAALGEGLLFGPLAPGAFAAAGHYAAASAAFFTIAGGASALGSSGSMGGSSLSSGGFDQSARATESLGNVTVVFPKGKTVLDVNDPDIQDEFIAMFQKVTGNRNVNVIVGGS